MTGTEIAGSGQQERRALSWRSRGSESSWWTSAVELSSTLASKMDQVPTTLSGFTLPTLPWQAGAKDQSKAQLQRGSSFTGFTLPWRYNMEGNKPVELPKPADEPAVVAKAPKPAEEAPNYPVAESPRPPERTPLITTDVRSLSRVGESRRQTRRMPVDVAHPEREASPRTASLSTVNQEFLLGEAQAPGSARAPPLEGLQRQQFWAPREARADSPGVHPDAAIKRVDESSVVSSKTISHQSTRSLSRGPLFEQTAKYNAPHLLPAPPGSDGVVHVTKVEGSLPREEIFPGNTNSLAQLKLGKPASKSGENLSGLSKYPVLGGSSRVVRSCEALEGDAARAPASLPTSPRCSSQESRASRFLRKMKLGGRGSRVGAELANIDTKSGRRNGFGGVGKLPKEKGSKVMSNLIVSQHQKFTKSLESRKLEITNGSRSDPKPAKSPELRKSETTAGNAPDRISAKSLDPRKPEAAPNSSPGARKDEGNGVVEAPAKKSSSRWLFKWRWGSRPTTAKAPPKGVARCSETPKSPEAVGTVARVPAAQAGDASPSAEIMSDARETFLTKSDRFSSAGSSEKLATPKHRRGFSWGSGTSTSSAPFTPSHPRLPTRDAQELLLPPRRLPTPAQIGATGSFQEHTVAPEAKASGAEDDAVRRSMDGEVFEDCHGSFRSVESPGVGSHSAKKRSPSMGEIEWVPPPLPREQNLTIGDVAALCNSPLKFVFKCREIEHFNKFLRAQKKRLLGAVEKGNADRFCLVLSGTDLEVSSMVAAMCYAWLQENTVPKVTGDTWHAVPMIDISRHLMHKHKSAAWLFDACGIDAGALLFADEVELASLVGAGRIKMSIIGQDVLVTRNEVGSVCTLLAEKLLAEAQCLLQPRYMNSLLLAGILLDTENLDFASKRDTEMTTMLLVGSGSLGRNGFFNQLRQVEDDVRVAKLVTRNYGDTNQLPARSKFQDEAEPEHSDKDSCFTQSQDQTSTSEAGTSSSLDEDSPRLTQRASFKYSKLPPHSAPARSHRLPSPSGAGCTEDAKAVAHIRKAATQSASAGPLAYGHVSRGQRTANATRIRKKLFLYEA